MRLALAFDIAQLALYFESLDDSLNFRDQLVLLEWFGEVPEPILVAMAALVGCQIPERKRGGFLWGEGPPPPQG